MRAETFERSCVHMLDDISWNIHGDSDGGNDVKRCMSVELSHPPLRAGGMEAARSRLAVLHILIPT